VLLPVQPKKIGILPVFIFAVSMMICFFSSSVSIEVSPVEPMIRTAEVPLSCWNLSNVRNAPKSIEPSWLKGVTNATNEPVIFNFAIQFSVRFSASGQILRHLPPAQGSGGANASRELLFGIAGHNCAYARDQSFISLKWRPLPGKLSLQRISE